MSLLSKALTQHFSRLQAAAGESVVIQRGSLKACVTAVPGESRFDLVQSDGTIVEFRTHDFIVSVDALDFGSGPTLPQRKDKVIWETDDCETRYFEVLPDNSLPHYRRIGPGSSSFRIFTKEKAS